MAHPLVREAMRKAAVAWVAVGERPATLLWVLPAEDTLWVVTGPGEQAAPGLAEAQEALVTMRGDHGGRIVTWRAEVTRLTPDDPRWPQVAPQLALKRLNTPGDVAHTVDRWARECVVLALTPTGDPVEAGPTLPDDDLARPPGGRRPSVAPAAP